MIHLVGYFIVDKCVCADANDVPESSYLPLDETTRVISVETPEYEQLDVELNFHHNRSTRPTRIGQQHVTTRSRPSIETKQEIQTKMAFSNSFR